MDSGDSEPAWLDSTGGSLRQPPGCASAFEDGSVDFVVCLVDPHDAIFKVAGQPPSIEACSYIAIGREKLIPLSAPKEDGNPLHRLDTGPRFSASYLGYSRECSLGWAVEGLISSRKDLPQLNSLYENSLADGLRTMALSGLGIAWLPLTTTHNDILRGKLVRAGDPSLDIDLDIRIYRPPHKLPKRANGWLQSTVVANVEAPGPNIIMRHLTPERAMTPRNPGLTAYRN